MRSVDEARRVKRSALIQVISRSHVGQVRLSPPAGAYSREAAQGPSCDWRRRHHTPVGCNEKGKVGGGRAAGAGGRADEAKGRMRRQGAWFTKGGCREELGGAAAPLLPRAQCDVATRHVRWQHTPGEVQRTKVTFFLPIVYRRAQRRFHPRPHASLSCYTGPILDIPKISCPITAGFCYRSVHRLYKGPSF